MALTVTQSKRNSVAGSKVTAFVTVTFDDDYPAGGELFDATAYVKTPDSVLITNDSATGYIIKYDPTNKKLKVFNTAASDQTPTADITAAALAEVTAATDLQTLTCDLVISGGRA